MMWTDNFNILLPTALLLVACVFDVKTGRFPNWLFVVSAVASFSFLIFKTPQLDLWLPAFAIASVFFVALTPLFFVGALGAGDLKLMFVFCLLTNVQASMWTLTYSLFWGLLMGVLKLALAGELTAFAQSFVLRNPQVQNQKIPYTVALLLGWLSLVSQGGV
jgi:Flp pilus assembly protein protease CpaA